jgi:hypothetical protein
VDWVECYNESVGDDSAIRFSCSSFVSSGVRLGCSGVDVSQSFFVGQRQVEAKRQNKANPYIFLPQGWP